MRKVVNAILSAVIFALIVLLGVFSYLAFFKDNDNVIKEDEEIVEEVKPVEQVDDKEDERETFFGVVIDYEESPSILTSKDEINLHAAGDEGYYEFSYDGINFSCVYTPDNWTIYNSYLVRNSKDMELICEALSDIHPIHGADMVSYRTPQDMAYEWLQHNIAYELLPESSFKQSAKDVDLDPADQGKSLEELYRSRNQW